MAQIMVCQTFYIFSTPWGTFSHMQTCQMLNRGQIPYNDGSGMDLEHNNF